MSVYATIYLLTLNRPSMSLHAQIREDVKEALRSRDKGTLSALRTLLAELTNEAIAKNFEQGKDLPDEMVQAVVQRLTKQRRDSIAQFESGGRNDLAEAEKKELEALSQYLPEQMDEEGIRSFLKEKIEELGLTNSSQVGALMGSTMKELKGKADGETVKRLGAELLSEKENTYSVSGVYMKRYGTRAQSPAYSTPMRGARFT